jgi:sodium/bile acid cotransporter 7
MISLASGAQSDSAEYAAMVDMYEEYRADDFPRAPQITVEEYAALADSGAVVLVDVRERRERRISIIPGAITRSEFEKRRDQYADRLVVVYCTIGYRSGEYTEEIMDSVRAANLIGGVLAWAHAGKRFVKGGQPTRKVHVYGRKWNLLPAGYSAVW